MILDSSVAVEVALGSHTGRRAIPILADELFVPELFFAEFHSVLHKLRLRKIVDAETTRKARTVLKGLHVLALPVHHLEDQLWKTAQGVSAYDAHYVVLARETKMPLATCDRRLAGSAVPGVEFVVVD
jgi:predicted nucleic acid-binding protein